MGAKYGRPLVRKQIEIKCYSGDAFKNVICLLMSISESVFDNFAIKYIFTHPFVNAAILSRQFSNPVIFIINLRSIVMM